MIANIRNTWLRRALIVAYCVTLGPFHLVICGPRELVDDVRAAWRGS